LFKKSASGKVLQWDISVLGTAITVTHGQVGGKLQTTTDTIKSGKNAGKKNATAPEEQALKEAKAKWTKQKKAGYVDSISKAEAGATDELIEGGALPMLAKVYEDCESKVTYPIAVQPKLDGHRCIAVINAKCEVSLWTRTRKRITSVPHIEKRLSAIAQSMKPLLVRLRIEGEKNITLDGEIYNHDMKDNFEKLTSAARKEGGNEDSTSLQYHIYDMMAPRCFKERFEALQKELATCSVIHLVSTKFANSAEEAAMYFTLYTKLGYEGSMVRLLGIPYENKRSHQLLKVKKFLDEEFEIVGMEEGRGKLQGHAGAFVCKTKDSKIFRAKMSGETAKLKEYWEKRDDYVGQILTVQFQGKTGEGLPRFPVGLRIREDL